MKKPTTERSPLLTPGKVRKLVAEVRKGVYQRDAALLAGLKPRSVEDWKAQGLANPDGPYGEFALRLEKARAEFCAKSDKRDAASKEARDRQWHKERLNPKRYHLATRVIVDEGRDELVSAVERAATEVLVDAELRAKFLARCHALLAGGEDGEMGGAGGAG